MVAYNYGDGGAFPEIHRSQFPLDMARPDRKSNALAVTTDAKGTIQNTALVKGKGDKTVYSKYEDLAPKTYTDDDLARPCEDELDDGIEATRRLLEARLNTKVASKTPQGPQGADGKSTFFRYNPSETAAGGPQVNNRMIKMVEVQKDPLEPSKFKVKRVPAGPPSPQAPLLHSPPRKSTVEDMKNWKVPPCISNWKNPKGYTIPLEKRLIADGRGLQEVSISDNFVTLSNSLAVAENEARKEVEKRIAVGKRISLKEKEKKENALKAKAMLARAEKDKLQESRLMSDMTKEERDEERKRNEVRQERRRQWEHERRIQAHKDSGRGRTDREVTRDANERQALGIAQPSAVGDTYLDQRLFNQDSGMDSGFGNNEDEGGAFTKSLLSGADKKHKQFRANREMLDDEHRKQSGRTDTGRNIEFETSKDADPFDMDTILDDVKAAASTKRPSGRDSDRKRRRSSSWSSSDSRSRRRRR